jgi:hypothetical protein
MRPFSGLLLGLAASLPGLADAFATPANLAKLAEREALTIDAIVEGLAALKQKRLLVDASQPIQGVQLRKPKQHPVTDVMRR